MIISLFNSTNAFSMILTSVWFKLNNDWEMLYVLCFIFNGLVPVLIQLYLPESPKLLFALLRIDETTDSLKSIAKTNKSYLEDSDIDGIVFDKLLTDLEVDINLTEMWYDQTLRLNTLCLAALLSVGSFSY